jgi:hypothetical protein
MSAHADFGAVLLAPTFQCPPGLKTWNGSDPAKRFGVYRNNVVVGLVDALADSYPVVQALVGEDFFRAMAAEFVRQSPPRSPVLAWYGDGFAEFVETFPPVAGLPYLAGVARLEWLRVEAWHAADAVPLPMDRIADLLADAESLPQTRFTLHPALRVLRSQHPVVSLWAAHQTDDPAAALTEIDMADAEAALLLRPDLDVEIMRIEPGAAAFIGRLLTGETFGTATIAEDFDLPATLGLLIRSGAIVVTARSSS